MAIFQQCPECKTIQKLSNKKCCHKNTYGIECGTDLDKAKKNKRVKYYIYYRDNGKQVKKLSGFSIETAKAEDGKIKSKKKEKRENEILDILKDKKTFQELTDWFLEQPKIKNLAYYETLKINLESFNKVFGSIFPNNIKPIDLENYQIERKKAGKSDSYIDQEIGAARNVLNKAWDNDEISGDCLKPFKKIDKLLKKNSNARDIVLSHENFLKLMDNLPLHAQGAAATAYYTGMRKGEIFNLTWDRVDLKNKVIELELEHTKDKEKRYIPICESLFTILDKLTPVDYDNHVFIFRRKPLTGIRDSLRTACKAIGLPYGRRTKNGFTFHDFRHTFNTNMRKAGLHDTITMAVTGHSTREMFDRYNTIDETEKRLAVNQMEKFLENNKPAE